MLTIYRNLLLSALLAGPVSMLTSIPAAAKTCKELRALCYTMRDDKSDCTKPYQRCLETGTFITPLGRVFKATK